MALLFFLAPGQYCSDLKPLRCNGEKAPIMLVQSSAKGLVKFVPAVVLLPELACSIHATWGHLFAEPCTFAYGFLLLLVFPEPRSALSPSLLHPQGRWRQFGASFFAAAIAVAAKCFRQMITKLPREPRKTGVIPSSSILSISPLLGPRVMMEPWNILLMHLTGFIGA